MKDRLQNRLMLLLLLVTAIAAAVAAGTAVAQTDAYSVEVAVADRGDEEQQDAYMAALRRVLLDNSGDKTLLNRNEVREALKSAENYVAGFSYRMPPPGTVISSETPITDEVRRTGQATQLMLVSFDRQLVRQLIDASGSSTQAERGETGASFRQPDNALVWLLIQDDERDIMISDPAAANVQSRAREIAGAAGISLIFPVGDEEDQQGVGLEDLLVRDRDRIVAASSRYEPEVVLIGTLSRSGAAGWQGEWTRASADERQEMAFEAVSLDQALQQGLSLLGTGVALDERYRYGGSAASDTEALIWVGSLNSIEDYATVMSFFENIPTVSTVYPKQVTDTSMVFAVLPRNSLGDIDTAVSGQSWLRRTAPPVLEQPASLSRNADLALDYGR